MENLKNDVVITGFKTSNEGVILKLNKKTSLLTGNIKNDEFYVSWDKIGKSLFKNYCDSSEVSDYRKLRDEYIYCMPDNVNTKEENEQYLKDIGATKVYSKRLLKDNKWQVIDQHENNHFQGSEIECMQWISLQ